MRISLRWFSVVLVWSVARLLAHDPGLSNVEFRLSAESVELSVFFAPSDYELLQKTTRWQTAEEFLGKGLPVKFSGVVVAPIRVSEDKSDADYRGLKATWVRPANGAVLQVKSLWLKLLPPNHREYIEIKDQADVVVSAKLVKAQEASFSYALPATAGGKAEVKASDAEREHAATTGWGDFFKLGMEHIFTGYDHLLFLLGLLVVCQNFRAIAVIITCFTVAHSITLGLAALDVVSIPPAVVEPLIAASIVYVGVENLLRRGEPRGRWLLTLCFGLIHGFGFASVLRELGLGGGAGVAVPLVSFNLGVEAGQLAIAAVGLPILWGLRRWPWYVKHGAKVISVAVVAAGLYWLVERTMLSGL